MTVPRVLIAGESWTVHSIHQKGFDSFTTTEYAEGAGWRRVHLGLRSALGAASFRRMVRLWPAVGTDCSVGGAQALMVKVQHRRIMAAHRDPARIPR